MFTVTPTMYAGLIVCVAFSMVNFLIMMYLIIQHEANKRSTHAIEYRDPFTDYSASSNSIKPLEEKLDEEEESQDIDGLNKFIKENEVIL